MTSMLLLLKHTIFNIQCLLKATWMKLALNLHNFHFFNFFFEYICKCIQIHYTVKACTVVVAEIHVVIVGLSLYWNQRALIHQKPWLTGCQSRCSLSLSANAPRTVMTGQRISSFSWVKDSMKYSHCWDCFFFSFTQAFE